MTILFARHCYQAVLLVAVIVRCKHRGRLPGIVILEVVSMVRWTEFVES